MADALNPTPIGKPKTDKAPYYAFVSDAADREALKAFFAGKQMTDANVLDGDVSTATEFLRANASPSVLFVEIPSAQAAPDLLNGLAEVCDPGTKVIVTGKVNEFSFYSWLMELGVSGYLLKPLTANALQGAWDKATAAPAAAAAAIKEPVKFVGFVSARGGSGGTTLSILTAAMLAQSSGKKTVIVDLDPQDGCVSLLLDVDPSRGLREALEKPDRIDSLFMDRVTQKTEIGLSVLSAEEPLHERITFHEQAAAALIAALEEQFEVVVLDVPRNLTPFVRAFLARCDTKFIVTDMTLQGLRDSLRLADMFRDYLRISPPRFIANRLGFASKQEMGEAEFKKGLNAEIDFHVPFAPDFFMSLGAELAPLKNKKAAAYKVLQQMVDSVLPPPEGEESGKKKTGFLKKGK